MIKASFYLIKLIKGREEKGFENAGKGKIKMKPSSFILKYIG